MAHGPANIQSPEVIQKFRAEFIAFGEKCRQTVEDIQRDVSRVQQWLEREQAAYWKREWRKRQEETQRARSIYNSARNERGPLKKISCVDEKKALDKAVRREEEAELKVRSIQKILATLDEKTTKSLGPVLTLSSMIALDVPKAVARLDSMLDRLDEYLRPSTGGPGAAPS